jgi:hypothetical protein
VGRGGERGQERPLEVRVEHLVPDPLGLLGVRVREDVAGPSGVVDQDIEPAEFFGQLVHRGPDFIVVADVGRSRGGAARQLRFGLAQALLAARDQPDLGAVLAERPCDRGADAAAAAGDDRPFPGQRLLDVEGTPRLSQLGCHRGAIYPKTPGLIRGTQLGRGR